MSTYQFWESLVYDDLEQLLFFYQVDQGWQVYLEEELVLGFLCAKYDVDVEKVTTFLELVEEAVQGTGPGRESRIQERVEERLTKIGNDLPLVELDKKVTGVDTDIYRALMDSTVDIEDYIYDTDLYIDNWTIVRVLQNKDIEPLEQLFLVKDRILFDEFSYELWLFVLGHDGTEEMADAFLELFSEEEEVQNNAWGPIAIGVAAGENKEMFSYLYEDLLAEEYYDTSEYYTEWTGKARELASKARNVSILNQFENL